MAFKVKKGRQGTSQPIEFMEGTNAEEFAIGEVLTTSSGVLTKGGADSTGAQDYICMANVTGATGVKNVPVIKIRKDLQFETTSTATVAASVIGSAVTIHTDGLHCTATTTNGVFVIDETDGANTNSTVVGHFISDGAI